MTSPTIDNWATPVPIQISGDGERYRCAWGRAAYFGPASGIAKFVTRMASHRAASKPKHKSGWLIFASGLRQCKEGLVLMIDGLLEQIRPVKKPCEVITPITHGTDQMAALYRREMDRLTNG